MKIYGLNTCIQWKLDIITSFMNDFIKKEQYSTDIPFNIMTVNLRDSKKKRCRDRDFSRLDILRDVETETLGDQEI